MTVADNGDASSNQFLICSICLENLASPSSIKLTTNDTNHQSVPTNMPGASRNRQQRQSAYQNNDSPNLTDVVVTRCGHIYHHVCLQEWFAKNNSKGSQNKQLCPTCREEITDGTVRVYPCYSTSQCNHSQPPSGNDVNRNLKEGAQKDDDDDMKEAVHTLLIKDHDELLDKYYKLKEDHEIKAAQITSLQEDNDRKDNENRQLKRKIGELQNSVTDGGSPKKRHP